MIQLRRFPLAALAAFLLAAPLARAADAPPPAAALALDSADLLKAYIFATAHQTPPAAEFTRYMGDDVQGGPDGAARARAAMNRVRGHPAVVFTLDNIALHAYDPARKAFPMDNKIFVPGQEYSFDVSPYHYVFTNPDGLNPLPCADAAEIARIGTLIKADPWLRLRVYGRVAGADLIQHRLSIRLVRVELLDRQGALLSSPLPNGP